MYDVIIIGAGPCGIFTALEYKKMNPNSKIIMFEKGRGLQNRVCPKRTTKKCVGCSPCNITTGFSGAGAFSDGKLTLSTAVGGRIAEYIGEEKAMEVIGYVDDMYLSYGADKAVYGAEEVYDKFLEYQKDLSKHDLELVYSPLRHLGTEKSFDIYKKMQQDLEDSGVDIRFSSPVENIIIEDKKIKGVISKGEEYLSDKVVVAVGREGAHWLTKLCTEKGIEKRSSTVDIGVRVETHDEILGNINKDLYESKIIYKTKTFNDKVRTFCQNPSGIVSTEYYEDNLAVANGHSYKEKEYKTTNTNFALLVSLNLSEPFESPIDYGKNIVRNANMLSGNRVIVQRLGDLKKGRRSTHESIENCKVNATLVDAYPGDLSLALPYRVVKDLIEMFEALDGPFKGMASDDTLIYGVEVKFYSNEVITDSKFRSNIEGLYFGGDGSGHTRGLMQASANGVLIARSLV
ncbi:NAD(P)/FAD-dependent oxidoreductase [Clostridium cylindrosporum]|uniref:FAD-dependent protein C-terminal domain-containing protein n=1 Tax=Clostridium cylindrosporum DSM 605 TaxID=1121307 RepID=A0A0J8D7Z6_CLOCY|nr:FAD-dependent oxidoreductase [Clostridium cylindrosporum]KMT22170.1 hypothetical protein CLCY_4c01430 [Clostridium cylindrosporum DSM 605]